MRCPWRHGGGRDQGSRVLVREEVMNVDYQKIILVGNVTADAERRQSQDGEVAYTTFTVAVGDGKERTTYFPVAVFGKQGELAAEYVGKGRQLLVEGRLDVSENGRFNVAARRVVFGVPAKPPESSEAEA